MRFFCLQIANVLAEKNVICNAHGNGIFEMRTDGQNFGKRFMQMNRQRRIAAATPQNQLASEHNARDGIINMPDDRPIMHEKRIGNSAKSRQGLVLVDAN
ncbi:hypothetical protein DWB58_19360, partial [candidate division KSB1 bacterium]|nr:hypothetical protein [candidate division KSB1 bacterium]